MIYTSLPPVIRTNDEKIFTTLMRSDQTDSQLAAYIWDNYSNGYYKAFGCRNISQYMRERWAGTDAGRVAQIKSRSVQRLIREYRLAREIPLFRQNFDLISRSNRRLVAQVLTPENAQEWVEAALSLSQKDLELKIRNVPAEQDTERKTQRLYMGIYPETRAVWERAKDAARRAVAEEGGDPELMTDALCFEMICNEFLATYGEKVALLPVEAPDAVTSTASGAAD